MHQTDGILEQTLPLHFCLQVVYKKSAVFSGACGMYFGPCNRISMKLALFCFTVHEAEMYHENIHSHLETCPATFLEEH